jgi:hypothetical protein
MGVPSETTEHAVWHGTAGTRARQASAPPNNLERVPELRWWRNTAGQGARMAGPANTAGTLSNDCTNNNIENCDNHAREWIKGLQYGEDLSWQEPLQILTTGVFIKYYRPSALNRESICLISVRTVLHLLHLSCNCVSLFTQISQWHNVGSRKEHVFIEALIRYPLFGYLPPVLS